MAPTDPSSASSQSPSPGTQPAPLGPPVRTRRDRLRRLFLAGLITLVPGALAVYILISVFRLMDGLFAPVLVRAIDPFLPGFYIPGLGLILTLLLILALGWLSTNVFGRRFLTGTERLIQRVPVANTVYSTTKGMLEAVSRDQTEAFQRVVLVEYPKANLYAMAFVTGKTSWKGIDPNLEDTLLVFLPTTPNPTSGFLLLVPRAESIELPISVEEGIRMVISGGILLPDHPELAGVTPAAAVPAQPAGALKADDSPAPSQGTPSGEAEPEPEAQDARPAEVFPATVVDPGDRLV